MDFSLVTDWVVEEAREHPIRFTLAAGGALYTLVRALGVTVRTGTRGLKYSFGRATRVLEPGFHPLIPFVQVVRKLPTRERTLSLPRQRVVTADDYVFLVTVHLIYRVVEIDKALVQIDALGKGMRERLGMSVLEVVSRARRWALHGTDVTQDLERNLQQHCTAWGVEVIRAEFTTISPSPKTQRITQLELRTRERARSLSLFVERGCSLAEALALLGSARFPRTRRSLAIEREWRARQRRTIRRKLDQVTELLEPDPKERSLRRQIARRMTASRDASRAARIAR